MAFWLKGYAWPQDLRVLGPIGLGGTGDLRIGSGVKIVSLSRYNRAGINHPVQLAVEPRATLSIGDRVGISGGAIYCSQMITIGDDVLLGANCRIYDTDFHPLAAADRLAGKPPQTAPVAIGNNVWLGANVTVLKGITIGAGTVVAAGSVVTRDLPANCLAAGSPARVVRHINQ
jgi:acetyltransferase-like isoleucine patch superfamily enzyme